MEPMTDDLQAALHWECHGTEPVHGCDICERVAFGIVRAARAAAAPPSGAPVEGLAADAFATEAMAEALRTFTPPTTYEEWQASVDRSYEGDAEVILAKLDAMGWHLTPAEPPVESGLFFDVERDRDYRRLQQAIRDHVGRGIHEPLHCTDDCAYDMASRYHHLAVVPEGEQP